MSGLFFYKAGKKNIVTTRAENVYTNTRRHPEDKAFGGLPGAARFYITGW